MGRSRRTKVIIWIILAVIILLGTAGFFIIRDVNRTVTQAYGVKRAKLVLQAYIAENNCQWPKSWDDLTRFVESTDMGDSAQDIDHLRQWVGVNWELDVEAFLATTTAEARRSMAPVYPTVKDATWGDEIEALHAHLVWTCSSSVDGELEE